MQHVSAGVCVFMGPRWTTPPHGTTTVQVDVVDFGCNISSLKGLRGEGRGRGFCGEGVERGG